MKYFNSLPFLSFVFFLSSLNCSSQEKDSTKTTQLNEIIVSATRLNSKSPLPFSTVFKDEIEKRNLGQDIPVLMGFLPSVVTTSDAGNGFGYSGIRVRGSDASRVNVTINGIPYNDSESQLTYFVNMPDFASSLQSIQLQRGVGTSTNGSGAFGASLNLQTTDYSEKSFVEIANSYGSFNSYKNTLKFSSGLIKKHFEISGRLSNLHSDGYVDRAFSDLQSYFLQGSFIDKNTLIKLLIFGGKEKTYQSWFGVDATKMAQDRTYNSAGLYYDNLGNEQFYDNQTDNYQQHHAQFHWIEKLSENWNTNLAFHYTKGKGFFENYNEFAYPIDYGLEINPTMPGIGFVDVIDQKWLDNDFYSTTFSTNYKNKKINFIIGGSANKYEGKHYNDVIWTNANLNVPINGPYYEDFGVKTDATIYSKFNYQIDEKWNLFADLQYRVVDYKNKTVDQKYNFFNPKTGLSFIADKENQVYFSYSKGNREPNRTDFENGNPQPEKLDDFELGWRFENRKTQININGYLMNYNNQLVLTGELDNVGNPIRKNVGNSHRLGLEFDAQFILSEKWKTRPNFTISENKNHDFIYDNNFGIRTIANTNIAYSPNFIAGNILSFIPSKQFEITFLSKFVGEQFVTNYQNNEHRLDNYFTQDLSLIYQLKTKKTFKSIEFNLLINNVFDKKYESNGYVYGSLFYYPQAGINFLTGINLKF